MERFKGFFSKHERIWAHPSSGIKISVVKPSSSEAKIVRDRILNSRERLVNFSPGDDLPPEPQLLPVDVFPPDNMDSASATLTPEDEIENHMR